MSSYKTFDRGGKLIRRRITSSTSRSNPLKRWYYEQTPESYELLERTSNQLDEHVLYQNPAFEDTPIDESPEFEDIDLNPEQLEFETAAPTELTEATPLLDGTSVGIATGSTTVGTTSATGSSIAAGIGITLGSASVAAGATYNSGDKSKKTNTKLPIITFPDHQFIGPGNSIDEGVEPLDEDDRIALQHDLDYQRAKTPAEVRNADLIAIHSFTRDFVKTGNWHSFAGAAGLATKYGIESIAGLKYPNLHLPETSTKIYDYYTNNLEEPSFSGKIYMLWVKFDITLIL